MIDKHGRLCLAIRVARRCRAKDVMAVLKELMSLDPGTTLLCSENGPEIIAQALRFWAESRTSTMAYIEPGTPL